MEPFVGEIRAFAGPYVPEGWALCDGSSLSINTYQLLYTLIGTTYGGSGSTFNLPNLNGRVIVGTGQFAGGANYVLGQTGGTATVSISEAQMGSHTHTLNATTNPASSPMPTGNLLAKTMPLTNYVDIELYSTLPTGVTGPNITMDTTSVNMEGGNGAHSNVSPNIVMNYMIALVGLFPPRP